MRLPNKTKGFSCGERRAGADGGTQVTKDIIRHRKKNKKYILYFQINVSVKVDFNCEIFLI